MCNDVAKTLVQRKETNNIIAVEQYLIYTAIIASLKNDGGWKRVDVTLFQRHKLYNIII